MKNLDLGLFSLSMPDAYTPRMLMCLMPTTAREADVFMRNFSVSAEPIEPGVTSEQYFQHRRAELVANASAMGLSVAKVGTASALGVACPMLEATARTATGLPVRTLQVFAVKGILGYTMTGTALDDASYPEVREEFLEIFASVDVP